MSSDDKSHKDWAKEIEGRIKEYNIKRKAEKEGISSLREKYSRQLNDIIERIRILFEPVIQMYNGCFLGEKKKFFNIWWSLGIHSADIEGDYISPILELPDYYRLFFSLTLTDEGYVIRRYEMIPRSGKEVLGEDRKIMKPPDENIKKSIRGFLDLYHREYLQE